jgi:signal transduction histidine kinase
MNEVMQDAVNKAAQDYLLLREFTDNASHEMQTPLAIIRSRLDLLSQEVDLSESQSEILHSAYSAINRLARLNKALLLLTKIENRQFDQVVTVNLEEKLQDKVSQFRELWESNQISFSARLQKATIQMDTALCDILLNNLLSNAGNHNFPGGSIEVVLQEKSLSITNTSKAEAADQQLLFTRFYKGRADSAHNGLGLSIVKQICDLSGITITYRHTAGFHYFELSWS